MTYARRVSQISKTAKIAAAKEPTAENAARLVLRDMWHNKCGGRDSLKMIGLLQKELPNTFGDVLDLSLVNVEVTR